MEDRVRLRQLTSRLHKQLEDEGFIVESDGNGYPSVLYDKNEGSSLANLFERLASHGVAFVTDVKDVGGGPSGLMEMMVSKGGGNVKYLSCAYDGKDWIYHERP